MLCSPEDLFGEPGLWLSDAWNNPPPSLAKAKAYLMMAYDKVKHSQFCKWLEHSFEIFLASTRFSSIFS